MIERLHGGASRHPSKAPARLAMAAAIAVALLYGAAASAQQTQPVQDNGAPAKPGEPAKPKKDGKKDDKPVQELAGVTVTGVRASLQSAQQLKQNADQIVDSVTAVDIGALPDRSVTETLQRVSGVTIDHFMARNDPDHFSAEGSGVMIRGLTQVRSELNGRDVFSANSGRGLSFEDVPAELMAGVDVYKNPSAEIIEGGIGGTVNLRTRLPFDAPGRVIGFTGGVNEGDFAKKSKPSMSFLYSNVWKTENYGEFGALFDIAYSELATRSDGIQMEPYVKRNDAAVLNGTNFSNVYVPGGADWRTLDFQRRRIGLAGALQWRPTRDLELTSQVLRSDYRMQWDEFGGIFNDSSNNVHPATGTSFTYDGNGVFQSGSLASDSWRGNLNTDGVRFMADRRYSTQRTITTDWSNSLKYNINDQMVLYADAQFVKSTSQTLDFTVFDSIYLPNVTLSAPNGSKPTITTDPAYALNPANYFWSAAMDHHEQNKGIERALRLDLEYNFEDNKWLRYMKFGVRATSRSELNMNNGYNWGVVSDNWATVNSANGLADLATYLPHESTLYSYSNFFRGDVKIPSQLYFPSDKLVRDYHYAYQQLSSIQPNGWKPRDEFRKQDINDQSEKTKSAYGVLYFGNDTALGIPVDGNIGVRLVRTDVEANGYGQYPDLTSSGVDGGLKAIYNGTYFPLDARGHYKNALPSFNLRFKFTDSLQWRLAASKAMTRPDFTQLQPFLLMSATLNSDNTAVTKWNGTAGNPNLKPMRANQYDTALEWYFAPAGQLYTTLFYKDVRDYISSQTRTETFNGQPFEVTRPYNMGKGKIRGGEVGYQQFFDFLPGWLKGFGVQANFTYVDSKGGVNSATDPYSNTTVTGVVLPLEGLSKRSYNLVGMYELGNWSMRLAWNWRSRYLLTTSDAATHLPTWADDYGQLDGSIMYRLNKNVQFGLQTNNLTNATTKVLMGPTSYADGTIDHRLYNRGWFVNDRRYELVVRATF
ncbi:MULTISPECIES: TonB-dependent receptor [unclassified Dyella]|uniref:TonB-dependent receptor n=1 Tax=unclassified Dyella TaxID=2634549 RepID=UPI0020322C26|nr:MULTISPECIES: TonB-dependent receptor [unclassified Dyella]